VVAAALERVAARGARIALRVRGACGGALIFARVLRVLGLAVGLDLGAVRRARGGPGVGAGTAAPARSQEAERREQRHEKGGDLHARDPTPYNARVPVSRLTPAAVLLAACSGPGAHRPAGRAGIE